MKKKNKYILLFSLILLALMALGLWLRVYGTPGYVVLPEPDKNYTVKINSFMDAKYRFLLSDNSNKGYYFIASPGDGECGEYINANIVSIENNLSVSGMFAPVSCMRKNNVQPRLISMEAGKYIVKVYLGEVKIKNFEDNVYTLRIGMRKPGKGFLWGLRFYLSYHVGLFGSFYFFSLFVYFLGTVLFRVLFKRKY